MLPGAPARGRGAALNPGNRFEHVRLHVFGEELDRHGDEDMAGPSGHPETHVYDDHTRTIINPVDSPDIGFKWTINPYRGCEHGCVYCYARPTHEQLDFSCGLDFETRIFAKPDAPKLLRQELSSTRWKPQTIVMSGVTDCYQPLERKLRITRGCLEVLAECRQPVSVLTKNRLVLRDLDLLCELNAHRAVQVGLSLTTLNRGLAAKMEPRASSPADRLRAITRLTEAGLPVTVMVAPVLAGLTDWEVPGILAAAANAGARSATYTLLRLPYQVKDLLADWLRRHFPDRSRHIETLVRQTRGGKLYDPTFGTRQIGDGPVADQIGRVFRTFARRYGLDKPQPPLCAADFRRPVTSQLTLF